MLCKHVIRLLFMEIIYNDLEISPDFKSFYKSFLNSLYN